MNKQVKYCNYPTIKEAYVSVEGMPGKYDDNEIKSVLFSASKIYQEKGIELKNIPTIVIQTGLESEQLHRPHWIAQVQWNDSFAARVGHNYVSIHSINTEKLPYKTYEETLKPAIDHWLRIYSNTIQSPDLRPVSRVNFVYLNEFNLKIDHDFSLQKYFNITFGFDVGITDATLSSMNLVFELAHNDHNIVLKFTTRPITPDGLLPVLVEVSAIKNDIAALYFSNKEIIHKQIETLKEIAKEAFFNFITEETHKKLGAIYAEK